MRVLFDEQPDIHYLPHDLYTQDSEERSKIEKAAGTKSNHSDWVW